MSTNTKIFGAPSRLLCQQVLAFIVTTDCAVLGISSVVWEVIRDPQHQQMLGWKPEILIPVAVALSWYNKELKEFGKEAPDRWDSLWLPLVGSFGVSLWLCITAVRLLVVLSGLSTSGWNKGTPEEICGNAANKKCMLCTREMQHALQLDWQYMATFITITIASINLAVLSVAEMNQRIRVRRRKAFEIEVEKRESPNWGSDGITSSSSPQVQIAGCKAADSPWLVEWRGGSLDGELGFLFFL